MQPDTDRVMFLLGHVTTSDGTPLPNDTVVERVCNNRVRQQVYASARGDFNMQLGSRVDSVVDASADLTPQYGERNNNPETGIPRRELVRCELRASAAGFRYSVVSLVGLDTFGATVNVGQIVVQRAGKIEGSTLSAIPYRAPNDARKAYERGLQAEKTGKLPDAQKYFEKAVAVYPKYAIAWFQLGSVLQKQQQQNEAREAYLRATAIDTKFLPPYLSLASMAYQEQAWHDVLNFTGHILDLDPWNRTEFTGYMVDLDSFNYAEAYFFNAVANYRLGRIDAAEKSAVKAEHLDLLTHFPQLHLLMAEIFAEKNNYAAAISEIQTYLQLVPGAKQVDQVREQLAKWERLNGSASTAEKPEQN